MIVRKIIDRETYSLQKEVFEKFDFFNDATDTLAWLRARLHCENSVTVEQKHNLANAIWVIKQANEEFIKKFFKD